MEEEKEEEVAEEEEEEEACLHACLLWTSSNYSHQINT